MTHEAKVRRIMWIKRQLRGLFAGYLACPVNLIDTLSAAGLDAVLRWHEADFHDAERFRVRRGGRPRGRPRKAVTA